MNEINNEYLKIATMTNKEAAEVIKNMMCHAVIGRGSGKTLLMLKYNTALHKAIQCLEKYPDEESAKEELDFREFMEQLEKETECTFHPGLREDTFGSLQVLGWDEFPSTISNLPPEAFTRTNIVSPNDFSQFMNPPTSEKEEEEK